jgi:hypothetical protein
MELEIKEKWASKHEVSLSNLSTALKNPYPKIYITAQVSKTKELFKTHTNQIFCFAATKIKGLCFRLDIITA